jgi:hypothetical protein
MALIDGEAVALRKDGTSDFGAPAVWSGTEAGDFECNHLSRLAQFDAQLMMVAHDHDVRSTAGLVFRRGEMASIRSTIVSHTITQSRSLRCPMSIGRWSNGSPDRAKMIKVC